MACIAIVVQSRGNSGMNKTNSSPSRKASILLMENLTLFLPIQTQTTFKVGSTLTGSSRGQVGYHQHINKI